MSGLQIRTKPPSNTMGTLSPPVPVMPDEPPVFPLLVGKVALITGGAQGIGKATAATFAKAGAKVVICDVNEEKGTAAAEELSALVSKSEREGEGDDGSPAVVFVKCDVARSDEVRAVVAHAVERFGRLDIAVNNAGILTVGNSPPRPLTDLDERDWDTIIGVNLTGTALCCKWELRQMIEQAKDGGSVGAIVNITSVAGFAPVHNIPAYVTSKHGIIGLTKQAAMEGGVFGIRVNAVAPGSTRVEQTAARMASGFGQFSDDGPFFKRNVLLRRRALAHEVAQGVLWLVSDAASYVTGTCLPIEGGLLSRSIDGAKD